METFIGSLGRWYHVSMLNELNLFRCCLVRPPKDCWDAVAHLAIVIVRTFTDTRFS